MDKLKDIIYVEMEDMEFELTNLGAMLYLAQEGATVIADKNVISCAFNHARSSIDDLRAKLDEIRGALVQLSIAAEKAN